MKIISGGQTGVDRAALDAAMQLGLEIGGYCPRGRLAEDGPIPDRYPMVELPTASYAARTRANIRAAGATLILIAEESDMAGGTALTLRMAKESHDKGTCRLAAIGIQHADSIRLTAELFRKWLGDGISVVNVAGPRESKRPGIYLAAKALLLAALQEFPRGNSGGKQ